MAEPTQAEFFLLVKFRSPMEAEDFLIPYPPGEPTQADHRAVVEFALEVLEFRERPGRHCVFDLMRKCDLGGRTFWRDYDGWGYDGAKAIAAGRSGVDTSEPHDD